jgi:hypothetical protein
MTVDYDALRRFEDHRKKVAKGLQDKGFVLTLPLREAAFEQAETTYKEELFKLHHRIGRQIADRRKKQGQSKAKALHAPQLA